jgi:hypothetical protein
MTDRVLSSLKKVITENSYDIKSSPGLFFNRKGPTTSGSGEIYIDCQPVGESEEETIIVTDSGSASEAMTVDELMQNKYFQMFLGCVIFLVIIYVAKILIGSYTPPKGMTGSGTGYRVGIASITSFGR